jgi:hypothetical protein
MTEMVHGARAARPGDPVLPRWWRSVDSWSIAAVVALCAIGLLLGLPVAERNGHAPFYYVTAPISARARCAGISRWASCVGTCSRRTRWVLPPCIPQAAFHRLCRLADVGLGRA